MQQEIENELKMSEDIRIEQALEEIERCLKVDCSKIKWAGEVLRFHPGIEKDFVRRWVEITEHSFRYFKSKYEALKRRRTNTGPIVSIPLSAISQVIKLRKDEFEVPKNRNAQQQRLLFTQLFEIKLKFEYEQIYKYRMVDKASLPVPKQFNMTPFRSSSKRKS